MEHSLTPHRDQVDALLRKMAARRPDLPSKALPAFDLSMILNEGVLHFIADRQDLSSERDHKADLRAIAQALAGVLLAVSDTYASLGGTADPVAKNARAEEIARALITNTVGIANAALADPMARGESSVQGGVTAPRGGRA